MVLIRHGESQVTVDQVVGGHAGCTGLSPLGRKQASLLRDRLVRTGELAGAAALYASVLPRAIETAEIIASALGSGDLPVRQDCGVCEIHPGEADGLTWQEFNDRFGPVPPDRFTPWAPGAETWAEFAVRAGATLRALVARHQGETVVVACHGGVIEASLVVLGGLPIDSPFDKHIENTSITEWVLPATGRPQLWRFNDAAHLQ